MNVLAFDTCFGACSAAVLRGAGPGATRLTCRFELCETGHAEALLPMIRAVMDESETAFADLDRIAVTVGPGTFTGTRTAIAAARGLALAARLPAVGASSLAVMAAGAERRLGGEGLSGNLAVAVDVRRGEVYAQLFERPGLVPRTAPLRLTYAAAARLGGADSLLLAGSGADKVAAEAAALGRRVVVRLTDLQPDAADLARMAPDLELGTEPVRPLYLREPDVTLPFLETTAVQPIRNR
ncbi:MAG TPA: tRNA (adenosine(37)-N6)-threonylcarbamoyltransferase complex dimerization subunit type 1 TsaB [Hyphomicrobiaceae bacterium]|nr:tRNA (adenosine(37)-N6)-threonylcarbamoyltransferase complex dimerization subunit type 1 TsaB [Hyphomicrobiaceae bacterium]